MSSNVNFSIRMSCAEQTIPFTELNSTKSTDQLPGLIPSAAQETARRGCSTSQTTASRTTRKSCFPCQTIFIHGRPYAFQSMRKQPSILEDLKGSVSKTAFSALRGIKAFGNAHREELIGGAKTLAGAAILGLFLTPLPSLIASVAMQAFSAMGVAFSISMGVAKITLCSVGVLCGLGLLLSPREETLTPM